MKQFKKLFELGGRNAIVTGGAGILGQHFCRALAEYGAGVAVVDVDSLKVEELATTLRREYDVPAVGLICDVSSPGSVADMVTNAVEAMGPIHILHNNAASKSADLDAFFAPFDRYTLEEWQRIMAVNIDGMFLVAQAVGAQMHKQATGGSIIQTSSIYGILASDSRIYEGSYYLGRQISNPVVYSVSKAAVCGLTRQLAALWATAGIRVNTLVPAGVESGQNEEFKRRYSNRVPMGRMAFPHEMVGALIYLASDASSYVTGQELIVDGGLSTW